MEVSIRPGTAEDWAAYREIRLRMLTEAPDAYRSTYAHEAAFDEARWRERAGSPLLRLAYADAALVGTATGLGQLDGSVMVIAMYVAPELRGQRYADRLLDAIATAARAGAADRLVLHVASGNRAAMRCYTRYGFRPTGRSWPMERDPGVVEIELAYALERSAG